MANPTPATPATKKASKRQDAVKNVDEHVSPKDCFIWFKNSKEGWTPIPGTGCAHYVAHKLGMKSTRAACAEGYPFRVPDLVAGLPIVKADEVQVDDIWANGGLTHTGLVVEVKKDDKGNPNVTIEHCSSRQRGVVRNDWKPFFSGQGKFYRPRAKPAVVPEAKAPAARSRFPVHETFS